MSPRSAYFKIKPGSTGGYRAYFYGGNGELVWWSENYSSRANAQAAIDFARANAATAPLR